MGTCPVVCLVTVSFDVTRRIPISEGVQNSQLKRLDIVVILHKNHLDKRGNLEQEDEI
jgi:hypothetical protein